MIRTLYLGATDLASRLTFFAITTRKGSRKIVYSVYPVDVRCLDNPISGVYVPAHFREAAKASLAEIVKDWR